MGVYSVNSKKSFCGYPVLSELVLVQRKQRGCKVRVILMLFKQNNYMVYLAFFVQLNQSLIRWIFSLGPKYFQSIWEGAQIRDNR